MEMCDICGCGSLRQAGTDPSFLFLSDHFFTQLGSQPLTVKTTTLVNSLWTFLLWSSHGATALFWEGGVAPYLHLKAHDLTDPRVIYVFVE